MYAVSTRNTMANAKRIVPDAGLTIAPKRKRERLIEMSRKWAANREAEEARRRAQAEIAREREAAAKRSISDLLKQYRVIEVAGHRKSVRQIILEVAQEFDVLPRDITGASRSKHIVAARHEAMWRARRERPDMSLPQIGKAFGGRDHTTCLVAIRKMEKQKRGE